MIIEIRVPEDKCYDARIELGITLNEIKRQYTNMPTYKRIFILDVSWFRGLKIWHKYRKSKWKNYDKRY